MEQSAAADHAPDRGRANVPLEKDVPLEGEEHEAEEVEEGYHAVEDAVSLERCKWRRRLRSRQEMTPTEKRILTKANLLHPCIQSNNTHKTLLKIFRRQIRPIF